VAEFAVRPFSIRRGSLDDLEIIVEHRRAMFADMGHADDGLARMCVEFRPWLERKMKAGEYLAWFAAAEDGSIAAGLGLWLMDWPPHMVPGPPRANILNVYTRPESRRQGLARLLMESALAWCRDNGVHTVILHASEAGRPLYESMGFQATSEMRMVLKS
jgi:GNAT superfamily N-acetyltransferase